MFKSSDFKNNTTTGTLKEDQEKVLLRKRHPLSLQTRTVIEENTSLSKHIRFIAWTTTETVAIQSENFDFSFSMMPKRQISLVDFRVQTAHGQKGQPPEKKP